MNFGKQFGEVVVNVGNWIEFDYTDIQGVRKTWKGEVKEQHLWGYKIQTEDGVRSFRYGNIKNVKELV